MASALEHARPEDRSDGNHANYANSHELNGIGWGIIGSKDYSLVEQLHELRPSASFVISSYVRSTVYLCAL
jgi:hypothetical protein